MPSAESATHAATESGNDVPVPSVDAVNAMIGELFPGSNHLCTELTATSAVARRDVSDAELRPGAFISGPSQFGIADAPDQIAEFLGLVAKWEAIAAAVNDDPQAMAARVYDEVWSKVDTATYGG